MLSIAKIQSLAYYESLAQEDYYHQGQEPAGQWQGDLAEHFSLTGPAAGETYRHIFTGFEPFSGKQLVQRAGTEHRAGWDFTFSAPKSVSVVWSQATPSLQQQIETAQSNAVDAGRKFIEKQLITRRGKSGAQMENPESCIWASFIHSTSRSQDPQLHTHCLLANVCQRTDTSFGTLEPAGAFRAKLAAGAIYRAELANEMRKLNFSIERDGDSFKLAGNPALRQLEREFSKRREAILADMDKKGFTSAKSSEIVALSSREKKEFKPRPELFKEWKQIGDEYDFSLPAIFNAAPDDLPQEKSPEKIWEELTYHQSTFHSRDLTRIIAIDSQGRRTAADVHAKVEELLKAPEVVRLRGPDQTTRYTTQDLINIEKEILDCAARRSLEDFHPISQESLNTATSQLTLTEEQTAAFKHVVELPGGVKCIQGVAGAGKSYLMGACNKAWQHDSYDVIGATLAGKAAESLEDGSGIKSQTLHSLIFEIEQGKKQLSSKTIIVIDEAGMVGSRQMGKIMSIAEHARAKVVLVGDTRQLQPVEAGAAFRVIQGRVGAAALNDIRRQKNAWAVKAVHDFAAGNAIEGLKAFHEHGLVHIAPDRLHASMLLVRNWWQEHNLRKPGESLMITGTRAEAQHLNNLARQQMQEAGGLGASIRVNLDNGRNMQVAEGDRIIFTRNSKFLGVKNGHFATVEMIIPSLRGEGFRIKVQLDNGQNVTFNTSQYNHLDHGYAVTTHKAQGITVDRTYILGSESITSRELAYVQMSRHRDKAHIYLSEDADTSEILVLKEAARKMSLSRQAESSLDYKISKIDHNHKKSLEQDYDY